MSNENLSVIIPARNEEFLKQTVNSVLSTSCDTTEIIVILDGYKYELQSHPRVKIIYNEKSIGQRAACNQAVRESKSKYIMKLDAHCSVGPGFDKILALDCKYNWTVIPRMYVLDAFHWVCISCKKEYNQGPEVIRCDHCGEQLFDRKIIWQKKRRKRTDYMWFNEDLRVKYFDSRGLDNYEDIDKAKQKYTHKIRPWAQDEITDVMCGVGACFFMRRDYYLELGGLDEAHGSWGQVAVEIACKTWLSGGRHVVNKKTWFAHLFRTGHNFSWPYDNPAKAQEKARKYSKDLWLNNKWESPTKKYTFDYIIKKFAPLPGFDEIESKKIGAVSDNNDITILYYTANKISEKFATKIKDQIKYAAPNIPIISISQKPIDDMGENICVGDIGQSCQNVYRQILMGAERAKTKYIVCCEDDTLYVPEHFQKRPQKESFAYNLNRWNLHSTKDIYSYWKRIVMSQCIADRKALIDHLKEKMALSDWPDNLCGEPGRFENQLGIQECKYETFETKDPNLVFVHDDGLVKRKKYGPDAEPTKTLFPWGNATLLLDHIYRVKQKKIPFRKHSKHTYIKQYVFHIDELCNNRLDYIHQDKAKYEKKFLEVFPPFIEMVAAGEKFTNEIFEKLPYYDYLISRLNKLDREPKLTEKGKRHVFFLMRQGVKLYHSIKDNGLRAPLDMYIENDRLVLHRGERRLEILKLLGRKRIPARIFKDLRAFKMHRPDIEWGITIPDKKTIHELAIQQFVRIGGKATDKYWAHGYTKLYDKEIGHLKDKPIKLLEIGVKKGFSLELWKQAFPLGEIFGIDKDEIKIDGFKIFKGNQQDVIFLKEVIKEIGSLDIIIDDGSHVPKQQRISFDILWSCLSPKGFYVIEDLHHNYKSEKGEMIGHLKTFIDKIYTDSTVASVNFYYNICFIRKN